MAEQLKFTRRDFLVAATSSVFTVVTTNVGEGITKVITDVFDSRKPENTNLFKKFLDIEAGIGIYPGEGNILSVQDGKGMVSTYIKSATRHFSKFLQGENPKNKQYVRVNWNDNDLLWDDEQDNLLLGGPVANIKGGILSGYEYDSENAFPVFRSKTKLRWGFDCGEGGFGIRNGKFETTKRIDDQRKIVDRPRYALIDNNSKEKLKFLKTDDNKFSKEDCLLITKLPNHESTSGRNILNIGGMHGHSIKCFGSNLKKHFEIIADSKRVGESEYFQILIPCNLTNFTDEIGVKHTEVTMRWDKIEYEPI